MRSPKPKRACFAGPDNLEYLNSGYFLGSGLSLGSGVEHPQVTHINHQPLNKLCPHCLGDYMVQFYQNLARRMDDVKFKIRRLRTCQNDIVISENLLRIKGRCTST